MASVHTRCVWGTAKTKKKKFGTFFVYNMHEEVPYEVQIPMVDRIIWFTIRFIRLDTSFKKKKDSNCAVESEIDWIVRFNLRFTMIHFDSLRFTTIQFYFYFCLHNAWNDVIFAKLWRYIEEIHGTGTICLSKYPCCIDTE